LTAGLPDGQIAGSTVVDIVRQRTIRYLYAIDWDRRNRAAVPILETEHACMIRRSRRRPGCRGIGFFGNEVCMRISVTFFDSIRNGTRSRFHESKLPAHSTST
jgi:hypothetical protein